MAPAAAPSAMDQETRASVLPVTLAVNVVLAPGTSVTARGAMVTAISGGGGGGGASLTVTVALADLLRSALAVATT